MPAEMRKMIDALKENELIPLTFDVMFTEIFNNPDNICILEEFVSNYLEIPLKDVSGNLKFIFKNNYYCCIINLGDQYEKSIIMYNGWGRN